MYRKYKLCQCPHCGSIRITTSVKKLDCKACGRSRVFYSKTNRIGQNVKILCSSDLWGVVHGVLKSIKEGELDFISYKVNK